VLNARIFFVTGTDTEVGKTVLTALLLRHLRQQGCRALALKPFCSGSRKDVTLLRSLQENELTVDEINPAYFPEPVAPLVAARKHQRQLRMTGAVDHIHTVARRCDVLLVEGAGGLLVPIAKGFTILDLIARLHCRVIVVARNKLGTINHTLLTVRALQSRKVVSRSSQPTLLSALTKVVLMNHSSRDASCGSNSTILREFLAPVPLITFPFLGRNCRALSAIKRNEKKFQKTLARILE
jgi:dethiobiotin synthetase